MIKIRFDGLRMRAEGHAGYAPVGEDVVCAGLSTLFATAAEIILEMEQEGMLAEEPVVKLSSGDVALEVVPLPEYRNVAEWLWEFLRTGCQMMAESFPPNVVMTAV